MNAAIVVSFYFDILLALAHYHAAISIDINSIESHEHEHSNNKRDEFQLNNNNSFALSDLTSDINVSPCALKKTHIKESLGCFEESMRLQRMSRDLKVNKHMRLLLPKQNVCAKHLMMISFVFSYTE